MARYGGVFSALNGVVQVVFALELAVRLFAHAPRLVELMDLSLPATPWAWVYYVSFAVLAVFVVVNLFIAIVINNLEAAKREPHGEESGDPGAIAARLTEIRDRLADIERDVRASGRPR